MTADQIVHETAAKMAEALGGLAEPKDRLRALACAAIICDQYTVAARIIAELMARERGTDI